LLLVRVHLSLRLDDDVAAVCAASIDVDPPDPAPGDMDFETLGHDMIADGTVLSCS
jgi:hypothetical protein